jgi:hypothetical protein
MAIKVHYASERINLTMDGTVNYALSEAGGLIGRKNLTYGIRNRYKHHIWDSGIFSLIYGKNGSKTIDSAFFDDYVSKYADLINGYPWDNSHYVELDVQEVTGMKKRWELNDELKKRMKEPEKLISVIHAGDSQKDVNRAVDEFEYTAIGFVGPSGKTKRPDIDAYRMCCYIKNRKPSIKIHLLGGTSKFLLKKCELVADTADSISWLQPIIYEGHDWRKSKLFKEAYALYPEYYDDPTIKEHRKQTTFVAYGYRKYLEEVIGPQD